MRRMMSNTEKRTLLEAQPEGTYLIFGDGGFSAIWMKEEAQYWRVCDQKSGNEIRRLSVDLVMVLNGSTPWNFS